MIKSVLKKALLATLMLGMLVSAAACGGGDTSTPSASPDEETPAAEDTEDKDAPAADDTAKTDDAAQAAPEGKELNVGVLIYKFDDNFMTLYREELQRFLEQDLAQKTGNTFKVSVQDGKNDQAEQTNQIQNFITSGVDVLVVNLVQSSAGQTVVDMCKAKDVPVVFINREPEASVLASWEKATYVGADARQSGTYQGEIVLATPNKGDINGDGVIKYIMVQGDPENVDAQYRTEFSIKALEDGGSKVEQLDMQRGDWDQARGQEIVANDLTKFGKDIEVVFCNNDGMALGAKQAIETAGRKINEDIYLVGVDALEEVVGYVESGNFTGTVFNDYINQSGIAAKVAYDLINGATVDDLYPVDYIKITPENAKTYLEDAKGAQAETLNNIK